MTLVEEARLKTSQSVAKLKDETRNKIKKRIMSAAEDGFCHVCINDIEENESRLINLWLISEGFKTDIRDYKSRYRKSIVIWW